MKHRPQNMTVQEERKPKRKDQPRHSPEWLAGRIDQCSAIMAQTARDIAACVWTQNGGATASKQIYGASRVVGDWAREIRKAVKAGKDGAK